MADLSNVDLVDLVSTYTTLRRESTTSRCGPCPSCKGTDRFVVRLKSRRGRPIWQCRQCHEKWGDAADFLVFVGQAATIGEALRLLGSDAPTGDRPEPRPIEPPEPVTPPPSAWQERGRSFADYARRVLWSDAGAAGLELLRRRGLSDDAIRAAGLGYNPKAISDDPRRWGIEPDPDDDKGVWLPVGVVVPAYIGESLWYVKVRVGPGDYRHVRGGRGATLYNADVLQPRRPAVLVESELDALALQQVAGDLAAAVATGTTNGAHKLKWLARVNLASLVLIALDNDPNRAGEKAAPWWLDALGEKARRWAPTRKDPGDILKEDGADALRAWVVAGLEGHAAAAEQVLLSDPAAVGDLPQLAQLADGDALGDVCECGAPVDRYTATGQPMCAACYAQAVGSEAA